MTRSPGDLMQWASYQLRAFLVNVVVATSDWQIGLWISQSLKCVRMVLFHSTK